MFSVIGELYKGKIIQEIIEVEGYAELILIFDDKSRKRVGYDKFVKFLETLGLNLDSK